MLNRVGSLFGLGIQYNAGYNRERARGLMIAALLTLVAWLVWIVAGSAPVMASGGARAIVSVLLPIGIVAVLVAVRREHLEIAAALLVVSLADLVAPHVLWQFGGERPLLSAAMLLLIPMAAATVLLDRSGIFLTGIGLLVIAGLRAYFQSTANTPFLLIPSVPAATDLLLVAGVIVAILVLPLLFGGSGGRAVSGARAEISRLREISAYVARTGETRDSSALSALTADVVRQQLGYAVAQIYLLDVDGTLTRRLRSGPAAALSNDIVHPTSGEAEALADAVSRKGLVTFIAGNDYAGHLIMPAVSSVVLPILNRGTVVGAIDVQSLSSSFSEDELADLALLAEEFGSSLARLDMMTDMQRIITEQEQINTSLRSQVASLRRTEEGSVMREWLHYFDGRGQSAFGFDLPVGVPVDMPVAAAGLPEALVPALDQTEANVELHGDEQIINVPIVFRGETLGAMSFAVARNQPVTRQQLEAAQTIGSRLGLALDNTRLFEQSQAQALRERKAGEIASLLISATDVQSVLNLAADSFNQALGAVFTRIYVQPEFVAEPISGEETT